RQQLALTHPGAFQAPIMLLSSRPGMTQELQFDQIIEQSTVVIRQRYILLWCKHSLRRSRDTFPSRREQPWLFGCAIRAANEPVEQLKIVDAKACPRRIPFTQRAYRQCQSLLQQGRGQWVLHILSHCIGLLESLYLAV